jgi:hypothetical protein
MHGCSGLALFIPPALHCQDAAQRHTRPSPTLQVRRVVRRQLPTFSVYWSADVRSLQNPSISFARASELSSLPAVALMIACVVRWHGEQARLAAHPVSP